jgi:hypothetical protein
MYADKRHMMLLLIGIVYFSSCHENERNVVEKSEMRINDKDQSNNLDTCLSLIKVVCDNYRPSEKINPKLPVLNDTLQMCLSLIVKYKRDEALENILCVLLKSYKAQLKCCNQSYDLCNDGPIDSIHNPFVYYFSNISGTPIYCHETPSSLPYEWLLKNKSSNLYRPLAALALEIEIEESRIRKGI